MHKPKDRNNRLPILFDKYIHNACSNEELHEFFTLMKQVPEELVELLKRQWEESKEPAEVDEAHWNHLFGSMIDEAKLIEQIAEDIPEATEPRHVVHLGQHRKTRWLRIAAAAAAVVILGYGFWFFALRQGSETAPSVAVEQPVQDIAPGGNKAVLTLGDGTKVVLDAVGSGAITNQGTASVIKTGDGELAYIPSEAGNNNLPATYNTVRTPRGGQYQLVLSDGTRVWLNAASSIRFPAVFDGNDRRVEITGEGYFEVAPDKQRPFYVSAGSVSVQVLGTHFNINAYDDEESIRTTLLEGSVKVSSPGQSLTIQPGQQAKLRRSSQRLETINKVDLEQAVAWKNGYFSFDNLGFGDIMRSLARWYDLDVVYEGSVPDIGIGGKMGRDVRLSKLLEFLESAGVHFRIDGNNRKLMVITGE